jgi:hypothetical protein
VAVNVCLWTMGETISCRWNEWRRATDNHALHLILPTIVNLIIQNGSCSGCPRWFNINKFNLVRKLTKRGYLFPELFICSGLTSQLGWRLLKTWWNGLQSGFPEVAMHTPYSFWGQTIAIRYHKAYICEHVWTRGMILGRFQGNYYVHHLLLLT